VGFHSAASAIPLLLAMCEEAVGAQTDPVSGT